MVRFSRMSICVNGLARVWGRSSSRWVYMREDSKWACKEYGCLVPA